MLHSHLLPFKNTSINLHEKKVTVLLLGPGYLTGSPSLVFGFLSIYSRVTIIYADVMHVIVTFTKTRRRTTKTHSLISNGRLRGQFLP